MATHRPVVLIGGKLSLLPAGDTLAAKVQEVDVIELQAKEVLVAGMAVYCSAGFQVMKAKADDDTKANVLGLALSAAALDAYVQVQTDGVLELSDWTQSAGSAALEVGTDYFLDTTAGVLTGNVPASGNLVYVGRAIAPQRLEISIQRAIKL
ncbi:MAG: capsid cement protein [Rhodospirillaceae bacterium]